MKLQIFRDVNLMEFGLGGPTFATMEPGAGNYMRFGGCCRAIVPIRPMGLNSQP
jgi:hypothetical protein